jgi:hypothetical protein
VGTVGEASGVRFFFRSSSCSFRPLFCYPQCFYLPYEIPTCHYCCWSSSCWGSSVIKGADWKFHMYSSGILGKWGLVVWAPNVALTHAVSGTLDGVYTAREDIMRGSNPQITQFQGEYRLWHTLSGGPGGLAQKASTRPAQMALPRTHAEMSLL